MHRQEEWPKIINPNTLLLDPATGMIPTVKGSFLAQQPLTTQNRCNLSSPCINLSNLCSPCHPCTLSNLITSNLCSLPTCSLFNPYILNNLNTSNLCSLSNPGNLCILNHLGSLSRYLPPLMSPACGRATR